LAVCTESANSREDWATDAYKKNCDSVIFIQGDKKVEERRGNAVDAERNFNGMGSGFVIDERGYIVTNLHVVKDLHKIQVTTNDKQEYVADIVAKDVDTDLAIIKIKARTQLLPIAFGRSNDLMPGEVCMAIGNPFGYAFSLTDGRISAINREVPVSDSSLVYRSSIQTRTPINPGNSGGPLFNVNGEMIGINVAIRQGAANISFASPVDQVVEVAGKMMGELLEQQISHGLTVSQIEPSNYNAIKQFIVRVESVESNSPAALAGIQKGDILKAIGKHTIRNKLDVYRALLDLKPTDEIVFTIFRNREFHNVTVSVAAPKGGVFAQRSISPRPAAASTAAAAPKTASNPMTNEEKIAQWDKDVWENLGVRYAPIPAQDYKRMYPQFILAGRSEFPNGGLVVRAVRKGSPAEEANLTTGDIIVGITVAGSQPYAMTSANDIRFIGSQEWSKLQSKGESIQADVIRDNQHRATSITVR
jgi:serine protease Do